MLFLFLEFLHSLQFLEGDSISSSWRGQDFSLCHYQLHRRALHGAGPGPSGGLTLAGGLREGLTCSAPIRSREHIVQPPGSSHCMLRLSELSILFWCPCSTASSPGHRVQTTACEGLPTHPVIHLIGTQYLNSSSRTFDLKLSHHVFRRWNRVGPLIQKCTKKKILHP